MKHTAMIVLIIFGAFTAVSLTGALWASTEETAKALSGSEE